MVAAVKVKKTAKQVVLYSVTLFMYSSRQFDAVVAKVKNSSIIAYTCSRCIIGHSPTVRVSKGT